MNVEIYEYLYKPFLMQFIQFGGNENHYIRLGIKIKQIKETAQLYQKLLLPREMLSVIVGVGTQMQLLTHCNGIQLINYAHNKIIHRQECANAPSLACSHRLVKFLHFKPAKFY